MHAHADDLAAPRQIERMPLIPAVLPPTQLAALRTRHSSSSGLDDKDQTAIALNDDQDDAPAL